MKIRFQHCLSICLCLFVVSCNFIKQPTQALLGNNYIINNKRYTFTSRENFMKLDHIAELANVKKSAVTAVVPFNKVVDVYDFAEGSLNIAKDEWRDYSIESEATIYFY